MPKRIPIGAAKRFADDNGCRQVVIAAWDGDLVHVVTYGKTAEDCDNAAAAGDRYKAALGWPEQLNAKPSRLRKAESEIATLRARVEELERENRELRTQDDPAFTHAFKLRAEAAESRLSEATRLAVEALEPFAEAVRHADEGADAMGFARSFDEYEVAWPFPFKVLRRARTALNRLNAMKGESE